MKIIKEVYLSNRNLVQTSAEIQTLLGQIRLAIAAAVWPIGSPDFKLNPIKQGNGVKPIKYECMAYLKNQGWTLEKKLDLETDSKPGGIDACIELSNGTIAAFEWETGNISSSHRALNKLAIGAMKGKVALGVLVLPSREMYKYLTDRVGNFIEIAPYFDVWRSLPTQGVLLVIEVEHDVLDENAPLIPKGTDGRARKRKKKNAKARTKNVVINKKKLHPKAQ